MPEEKSVSGLREAIHALAQAIELIPDLYVSQDGKSKGLEARMFSELVKEALAKTSHH